MQQTPTREPEGRNRFRIVADSAPVMMWTSGAEAGCDWVNAAWLEFTGRSLDEELGDGWQQAIHPEDLERCVGIFDTSLEARQAFGIDCRMCRHDGCYRWVMFSGVPRCAEDDEGVVYDVLCRAIRNEP